MATEYEANAQPVPPAVVAPRVPRAYTVYTFVTQATLPALPPSDINSVLRCEIIPTASSDLVALLEAYATRDLVIYRNARLRHAKDGFLNAAFTVTLKTWSRAMSPDTVDEIVAPQFHATLQQLLRRCFGPDALVRSVYGDVRLAPFANSTRVRACRRRARGDGRRTARYLGRY